MCDDSSEDDESSLQSTDQMTFEPVVATNSLVDQND
jgi:hypothetical protein